MPQCTGTSKQSGKRCKRLATPGHAVCKIHGSASTGPKSGPTALKDPLRSKLLPEGLRDRYELALADETLISTRRNAALVELLVGETLENLGGAPSGKLWSDALATYRLLNDPDVTKETKSLAFTELGAMLESGMARSDAETKVLELLEHHRRHSETEQKREAQIDGPLNAAGISAILAAFVSVGHEFIPDAPTRKKFTERLASIFVDNLLDALTAEPDGTLHAKYARHPIAYAREVLGVRWWSAQRRIARAFVAYPKVMVLASHSVGKSHLMGGLINWSFDTAKPGLTLTTAPTKEGVVDVLWKETRRQRKDKQHFLPKAPRLESSEDHYAVGYTASSGEAFQGRHELSVRILFDEAIGIPGEYWDASEGMMTSPECRWLASMNPTDTGSRAYEESLTGEWHIETISVLDHPNIFAELAGLPPPFPAAVRLSWLLTRIKAWCQPVNPLLARATDFEFPPESGEWYRPGPLFESRCLGRFPTQGTDAVWSQAAWEAALVWSPTPRNQILEIGVDVARFGDDFTTIISRRGMAALTHETYNGNGIAFTVMRIKATVAENVRPGEDPKLVPIKIDDDGVGGGVTDMLLADGYNVVPVNASSVPFEPEQYPNRRSELWFAVADRAASLQLDLSRLPEDARTLLRRQLLAPKWSVDGRGRRVVEPKDVFKKRMKRSPDDADALNLAYAPAPLVLETQASGFAPINPRQGYTPR